MAYQDENQDLSYWQQRPQNTGWLDPNRTAQQNGAYTGGATNYAQTGDTSQMQQTSQTPQYQATVQTSQQGSNPFHAGMSNEDFRNALNQFAQSRGYAAPSDSSYNTWQGYYNQYGSNDPNYLWMRLQDTGEFGGQDQYGKSQYGSNGVNNMGTALSGQWGDRANSLYDQLMKMAGQSMIIDRNDPVIRNQSDNYAAMATRGMRNYLGDVAERGGPNANISAERRSAAEKVAQGTSNFEGQLMQHMYDTRNQQILAALSGAQGFLTDQQRMRLQEELAQQQLAQQAYQFDAGQQYAYSPFGSAY